MHIGSNRANKKFKFLLHLHYKPSNPNTLEIIKNEF